jgi:hypothetical protein
MMAYFNEVLKPLNDELREHIGLKKRSRKIPVTYIGDKGSFTALRETPETGPIDGYRLHYVEQITFAEYKRWLPF